MTLKTLLVATVFCVCFNFAARATDAIRPEMGKPLQAAQQLIREKNFRAALEKIREADGISGKTAYEISLVEQLRGIAAAGAGDPATAIRAFETLLEGDTLAAADRLKFMQAIADLAYQQKDYARSIAWANRYLRDGGTSDQTRRLLAQSLYLQNDFSGAVREIQAQIRAAERSGQTPTEDQLQLLANAYLKLNDTAGYASALERLVAAHPSADYWTLLLRRISVQNSLADRLQLDLGRLALNVGAVGSPGRYMELAQLALQAGLPGEAKSILDRGASAGLLGSGDAGDVERQKRLHELAEKSALADLKSLPASEQEAAAARDGTGLVNTGLDYVGHGQIAKGIALIEDGIRKGGLKHPEDAKLRLGVAYLAAGRREKALETLRQVGGTDGTAELAHLWLIHATRAG